MLRSSPRLTLAALTVLTFVAGGVGGWGFTVLGLPAGWLAGAMVVVAALAIAGVPCAVPDALRSVVFVVLGLSMGSGVKPETVARIGEWPVTMALLVVAVVAILLATYVYQRRVAGWDRQTAYFAAIPGALSYVMVLTLGYPKADMARVALAQSLRVFILVAILPLALTGGGVAPLTPEAAAEPFVGGGLLLLLVLAGAGTGWAAQRLGVPAGALTGPFFLSAILNASGLFVFTLPDWMTVPCFAALGCIIGCRFASVSPAALGRLLVVSLGAFAVGMSISLLISAAVWAFLGIPFGQVLLAFAPGGLEAMTLLAFLLDLDPAFVAAHQLVRYIGMVLILPFVTSRVLGPPETKAAGRKRSTMRGSA